MPPDEEDSIASVVDGEFIEPCMRELKRAVEQTGAQILLSSTWRETVPQRRAVDDQLVAHGLPISAGCTPRLSVLRGGRAAEIEKWVELQRPQRWCAVDDLDLCTATCNGGPFLADENFVKVDPELGLTPSNADRIIQLLQSR
eukprot:CAMPEP_0119328320 /NCGR_PEP_ID=MMETSP1333-20130426/73030_1 /TAXON_ID=418940 /ORGANISM="Scyphosphaera apsteinii, Strain RCC1455" /LENGTH=142 /DNA_ID=CAMNT_0007337131 /DNA_START=277 /DNA_END=705 /DNA_ORIENTATION=+